MVQIFKFKRKSIKYFKRYYDVTDKHYVPFLITCSKSRRKYIWFLSHFTCILLKILSPGVGYKIV
jgi:hypothetical protein